MEQESKATQAAAELQPAETGPVQSGLADGTPAPGGAPAPAGPSLKEEFRAAESDLTDAERARLKTVQQELIGKFLVIGCVWGMVIGALISRFLLGVNSCIMMESTLSFLGFGDLYHPTWGTMINFAYKRGAFIRQAYSYLLTPGICIMLLSLSFFFLSLYFEGRRDTISEG